jgi:hypothetical protein
MADAELTRRLFEAFLEEAEKRKARLGTKDWIYLERLAVYKEAVAFCLEYELKIPTLVQIEKCENMALGHSDYGPKWALYVAELVGKINSV